MSPPQEKAPTIESDSEQDIKKYVDSLEGPERELAELAIESKKHQRQLEKDDPEKAAAAQGKFVTKGPAVGFLKRYQELVNEVSCDRQIKINEDISRLMREGN